jgi:Flp pilus assembly pilin Flp
MDVKGLQAKWRALASDSGQDLLEYALLASLIVIVAVGAVTQVGNTLNTVFWQAIASANV